MDKQNSKPLTDSTISAIDAAINKANARKAARNAGKGPSNSTSPTATPATKRPRVTDEEKAARKAEADKVRNERKVQRDAVREAKRAEKAASKATPHLKKVMKAAERLSPLGQAATLLFNEATATLSAVDLATLAAHIAHFNREQATKRAISSAKLEVGARVVVVGGDPRYVGKTGTVAKAQRIRAYVTLDGTTKPIYVFTADVSPVEASDKAAVSA